LDFDKRAKYLTGWWFQICVIFIPKLGEDSTKFDLRIFFGWVGGSTTKQFGVFVHFFPQNQLKCPPFLGGFGLFCSCEFCWLKKSGVFKPVKGTIVYPTHYLLRF